MAEKLNYIGISIPESTKRDFQKLCGQRGSNMSVEIKRFIYEELKKQELNVKEEK